MSSIAGVFMNKIALRVHVRVDDWTDERAVIASNGSNMRFINYQYWSPQKLKYEIPDGMVNKKNE